MAWPRGFMLVGRRQRLAGRDADLLLDQVDAGDHLGHRVLDLDARVHLHEVEAPVAVEQELDRAGVLVAARARAERDRGVAHLLAQLGRERRRRRLLDQLLVAALDRALALAQVDDVAVAVAEDLELDVARLDQVLLEVDRAVAEGLRRLVARGGELAVDLLGASTMRMPRPPPPAAALRITG